MTLRRISNFFTRLSLTMYERQLHDYEIRQYEIDSQQWDKKKIIHKVYADALNELFRPAPKFLQIDINMCEAAALVTELQLEHLKARYNLRDQWLNLNGKMPDSWAKSRLSQTYEHERKLIEKRQDGARNRQPVLPRSGAHGSEKIYTMPTHNMKDPRVIHVLRLVNQTNITRRNKEIQKAKEKLALVA